MTLTQLKAKYKAAKTAYYNAKPIMTDAQFDRLEDQIKKLAPTWAELKKTGVKVKKKEVELPEYMPSLNKAYPEKLPKWLAKYGDKQIAMAKLDGSALYLGFENGKPTRLITRGDGERGGDISFLIPFLNIKPLKTKASVSMRCEAVMPRKVFAKKWASKFDNARNMVNGILNRALNGEPHPALADIHVVVLGVYGQPIEKGLRLSKANGLRVVPYSVMTADDPGTYAKRLALVKENGVYEMDGLVLAPPSFVFGYDSPEKPKGTIAFKVNDEAGALVVEVRDIIWQVTGHSRIIPKIYINPTRIDGVMVKHATVHNAKWMQDRGIGPGAKVKVLRSGGVIPKIVGVVKAGKFKEPDIDYAQQGVHFVTVNADEATTLRVRVLQILKFMRTVEIEHVAVGSITRTQHVLKTPLHWLRAHTSGKLSAVLVKNGIGPKMAAKIDEEFAAVVSTAQPAARLMVALSVFDPGVGERKLKAIEDSGMSMKKLLRASISEIEQIKGFSRKTAQLVIRGVRVYSSMRDAVERQLDVNYELPKKQAKVKGKLSGQVVTFTGYRDAQHEDAVTKAGGTVASFSKKTTILVVKDGGKSSGKVDKAEAAGIKIVVFSDLNL